jgi:NADH:ubiquinone oxidoreductase subunit F (NADH-binding)
VSALAASVGTADRPRAPRRLLPGEPLTSHRAHLEHHGPLPSFARRPASLLDEIERSGLTGRGGAGFPTAVKLRAVAAGRRPVVVANGTEGEPASAKDKVLMARNPHLVVDGVLAAAAAVGADEAIVVVSRADATSFARLEAALRERPRETGGVRLASAPARFVTGEESALVHWLNGGPAKPTLTPPRPYERGVRGRPTLVQNVETLAGIGLIARHGADWFRELGTPEEPGSVLVTMLGGIRHPGVIEVELGTRLDRLVDRCGGLTARAQALLVGGYFGTWVAADALELPLTQSALRPVGASLGARTIAILPEGACGVAETARVVRYLAGESAGQCGPCLFGLDALASAIETIASCDGRAGHAVNRLSRLQRQVAGRGACAHPDGAVRLLTSALEVFEAEIAAHVAGYCTASSKQPVLPTHSKSSDWR